MSKREDDWDDDEADAYHEQRYEHEREQRWFEFTEALAAFAGLAAFGVLAWGLWFLFGTARMRTAPAVLCALGFAVLLAWSSAQRTPPAAPREPRPSPLGNARFAAGWMLDKARAVVSGVFDDAGILLGYFGGVPILYRGKNSLLLIGASGAGKLLTMLAPILLSWRAGSTVTNDPKGELAAITGRWRGRFSRLIVLNPFGLCSHLPHMRTARWNPLAELNPRAKSFARRCTALAEAIVLRSEGNGNARHFEDHARKLIQGVIAHVVSHPEETPTLVRVSEIVHLPDEVFIATTMEMAQSPLPICREAANVWSTRTTLNNELYSIKTTAMAQLESFSLDPGLAHLLSGSDFSFSDLKREKMSIFICLPEGEAKRYARFTRILYTSALQASMKRPAKPGVLFLLDELATSLGDEQLAAVTTAFSLGRGYGVRLLAVFQSEAQRKAIFGQKADEIVSSSGALVYYQASDETTFRCMSERAGNRTVWYDTTSSSSSISVGQSGNDRGVGSANTSHNWSTSNNTSTHASAQPLIDRKLAYELGVPSEENGWWARQVMFVQGLASPVLADRFAYFNDGNLPGTADPNPYVDADDEWDDDDAEDEADADDEAAE